MLDEIRRLAQERGIALMRTPAGLAFAPAEDGQVMSPEAFQRLPAPERERVEATLGELQRELQRAMLQVPRWDRERREKLKELNREVAMFAVGHLIDELRHEYATLREVIDYLSAVQQDVIDHAEDFLRSQEEGPHPPMETPLPHPLMGQPAFRRYQVNVLVDNSGLRGAPVIYEDHLTVQNLLGRIEHVPQMGALLTDFSLIKAGALQRANGGYLMLDAHKVLLQPFAWEELKRASRCWESCSASSAPSHSSPSRSRST